jgi:hypothetical protein
MRRSTAGWLVLLAGWASLVALPAAAQEAEALFEARLAAGEFAPAIETARAAATREQHDALLARVAVAQARWGQRDAALRTAGEMYDDRGRADVLGQVSAQPVGAWLGGRGGGAQADFNSLIELITSTVRPTTWEDVGGPGSIAPFETGVRIDAAGLLRPILETERSGALAALRAASAAGLSHGDARRASPMRKVSLTRLEREVQLRLAAGKQPAEAMHYLAGLQRIEYVFVYPESGDVVVAGPAGPWRTDAEGRVVGVETGVPVVRLDDLVVVFRHVLGDPEGRFGCLIVPRQEGLARLKAFAEESARRPLGPNERRQWLDRLQAALGKQDIEVYGLDPRTRAARVMVEADYRMKLVGMGIEEGVPGVASYLDSIELAPGEPPPPMGVLRWWFTLDYDAVTAAEDRRAFALRGQGVKVQSENEMLTAEGERIHTGESDELNRRFADGFTAQFEALARKYPIYGELRNLADLALAAAILRSEGLASQAGWHLTCFGPEGDYPIDLGPAPKEVQTVVNHRVIGRPGGRQVTVIAGASGGVRVDPLPLASHGAVGVDREGRLAGRRTDSAPAAMPRDAWWWD